MPQWHGDSRKRKSSGGRRRRSTKKRTYEMGNNPTETRLGATSKKLRKGQGKHFKITLLSEKNVNIMDPSTGITQRVEISKVLKNPVSFDYNRRGIITKGTLIETSLGEAKITSRPGQDGVINAILIKK